MRVILFILKCTVGLLASLGFLMLLAAVGLGMFWRQMEFFEKRETVVPERILRKAGNRGA
jgi:protease-4